MKFPAFRMYSKDWLSSLNVRRMDATQKGWFIQLLIEAWESSPQCFLPGDDMLLRVLAGAVGADDLKWQFVLQQFKKKGSKVYNVRQLREYTSLMAFRERKSQAGKNGAHTRWHSHSTATILPMANDSSACASASASASGTETHTQGGRGPTLQEVKEKAQFVGLTPEQAERFWHHFEASGWIDRNGHPIRSWQSKLATWTATSRSKPLEDAHKAAETPERNEYWKNSKRLDQVAAEIKAIEQRGSETPLGLIIEQRDKERYARLKADRKKIKTALGL